MGEVIEVLKGLSGSLRPNRLTAILGPSGAGKTSFLNILSGRTGAGDGKTLSGTILLRGKKIDPTTNRSRFAYVMQEDALYPAMDP